MAPRAKKKGRGGGRTGARALALAATLAAPLYPQLPEDDAFVLKEQDDKDGSSSDLESDMAAQQILYDD